MFRLALRQTEGLIGSIIDLLGLRLAVPTFSTLSRRAETEEVPRLRPCSSNDAVSQPVHLLVDSTGLKLCGAGEWLVEKHGTRRCRSWRKLTQNGAGWPLSEGASPVVQGRVSPCNLGPGVPTRAHARR